MAERTLYYSRICLTRPLVPVQVYNVRVHTVLNPSNVRERRTMSRCGAGMHRQQRGAGGVAAGARRGDRRARPRGLDAATRRRALRILGDRQVRTHTHRRIVYILINIHIHVRILVVFPAPHLLSSASSAFSAFHFATSPLTTSSILSRNCVPFTRDSTALLPCCLGVTSPPAPRHANKYNVTYGYGYRYKYKYEYVTHTCTRTTCACCIAIASPDTDLSTLHTRHLRVGIAFNELRRRTAAPRWSTPRARGHSVCVFECDLLLRPTCSTPAHFAYPLPLKSFACQRNQG